MNERPPPIARLSKKACLLGEFAVGKTSLVRRFVYDLFDDHYISTIGVKVSRKTVAVQSNGGIAELTLMLWDLAGSEEFGRVRASYLRGASGAVLVCDLTRPTTLDGLQGYVKELRAVSPGAYLVVAANKADLVERPSVANHMVLDAEQVRAEAARLGAPCYLTSAKTGNEVEALFRHLGQLLAERRP
jgi:small GTP-binding protein